MSVTFNDTSHGYKACVILMFITASSVVILNILAVVSMVTNQRKKTKDHRKSSAGAKRNELILTSLCVANVLLGIGVLADFGCYVGSKELWAGAYIIGFGLITSLIHIGMLTFERFIAVKFPFKYKEINPRFVIIMSIVVWLLSVLPALTIRYNFKIFLIVLFSLLLVSNIVIACVYSYIIVHIRHSNQSKSRSPGQPSSSLWYSKEQKEQQNKVTAFCCSIVISYVVSTMPSIIWYLTHCKEPQPLSPYSGRITEAMLFMLLISRSLTDPLIYIFRERIHKKFTDLHSRFGLKSEKNFSSSSSTGKEEEMKPCIDNEKHHP